ncbi:MAG: signal peptidase II [Selenomonas ruminantium]|nr:signal peptidase II [Selenomonas ruminantium]
MAATFLFFGILVLDQLVKGLIQISYLPGESTPLIDGVFHITYVLNPGAAFGLLENQTWFFILAAVVIILAFIRFYPQLRRECGFLHYGCVAMVAGAVGNLIDRIKTGLVVDFLDFRIWPVFNLADIAIVLGAASMVYAILFKIREDDES